MKQSQPFVFTTPIMWGNNHDKQRIELEISGVGYYFDGSGATDYDIEQVKADGQDFTKIYRLLESDQLSRLTDVIQGATEAHMAYLFSGQYVREEKALRCLENGQLDSNTLFEAIAMITKGYNDSLLGTPAQPHSRS